MTRRLFRSFVDERRREKQRRKKKRKNNQPPFGYQAFRRWIAREIIGQRDSFLYATERLSAVRQILPAENCRRATIFLRSHTYLFPLLPDSLNYPSVLFWSSEYRRASSNGGKERFRETNRSVVIPNNYHITFEPRAFYLYRNKENNAVVIHLREFFYSTFAVTSQLPVVFHFLISALLSAPADSSSLRCLISARKRAHQ